MNGTKRTSSGRHKIDGKILEPDVSSIPLIKQCDNPRLLPKYTSILAKTGENTVSMDDLDLLQQDLEKLLSTSAVRIRYLLAEIGETDKNDESHDKKADVKTSLKRKRIKGKPKHKDFKALPKFRAEKCHSDKFWASIEPLCANVTKDDVVFLDTLIQEYSKEIDIKIPEIGEHYANNWSDEIINEEQHLGKAHKKSSSTNDIKKNGLHTMVETFSMPQTQRLLAGLIEERVLHNHPKNGEVTKSNKVKGTDYAKMKSSLNSQKLGTCLDRRLKKELMEQGIITLEDMSKSIPDDEILSEIKKCQQELTTVNDYNIGELNKLKAVVENDFHSNELKEQLEKVDKEVLDLYNKIIIARKTAQEEDGDEFDEAIFSEQITKEFENQADALLKQQIELNQKINGLTDMQMIYCWLNSF
ncbi:unnamed protein product [Phyllotreta striolata]|uniref:Transcriptional adapter 3 n=1 Tax=Phyllotreta striolata TaxID=444603 RepID=A0A9N9XK96_PHYSR|nr:unnamed protein product [Phyllotreta striolata]